MSDGKFLTKQTTDSLANLIANKIKSKLPWYLRGFAKTGIKLLLTFVNKGGDRIIPDKADALINQSINQGIAGHWDAATHSLAKVENMLIDIPNQTESQEEVIFYANTNALVQNIKGWLENRK